MQDIPKDFNWVTQRAECVPFRVFKQIQVEIEADLNLRNGLLNATQKADGVGFSLDAKGEHFFIHRNGVRLITMIQFRLHNAIIEVRDADNKSILEATLTLNDEGRCMLVVAGKELETWQFRRRALENLLFGF